MFFTYQDKAVRVLFFLALFLNVVFWFSVRTVQPRWNNVPPVPDRKYASFHSLGDASFAYRLNGIMIQNLGDTGGRSTSLKDYDYDALTKWFYLQDYLDPFSDFIPYLAAYYFGSVQEPEQFRPVLDYLIQVGKRPDGEKWRWLAQGVYLARYTLKDLSKALEMAHILAQTKNKNVPGWVRQMPAFVMAERGEKDAAYALLLEILKTRGQNLDPSEVNSMKIYICTRLLDPGEAASNPLCIKG